MGFVRCQWVLREIAQVGRWRSVMLRLKLWLAAAGAFIVALFAAFYRGKAAGKSNAEAEELNEYIETRKRMDKVDGDTRHPDLREWLRERGER